MRSMLAPARRLVLILVAVAVLAACASRAPAPAAPAAPGPGPAPATTAEAAPAVAGAAPAAPKPRPTDAEIKQLTYDLLLAFDRGDLAAFEKRVAPEFLHFEGGHGSTREEEVERLKKRSPAAGFIASRTWEEEKVRIHDDSAVFTGKATERQGGNDKKGGYKYVGWYLVEWVRRGDAWQARLWTWHRGGDTEAREHWNDIYRNGFGFEKVPNRLLVETIKGRKPGTALDVATGQGRNALHLASQGWKVTGVDLSDEGLRMAREEAAKRKLSLETVNANLDEYDFGKARWDLVTMIYAGANVAWIEKIKTSLRPGGLFIVEFFAQSPVSPKAFAPGQLAALFADGYEILRDETVEDAPDWALDRAKLVRFVARKKR